MPDASERSSTSATADITAESGKSEGGAHWSVASPLESPVASNGVAARTDTRNFLQTIVGEVKAKVK
jgi:hypothetical protein